MNADTRDAQAQERSKEEEYHGHDPEFSLDEDDMPHLTPEVSYAYGGKRWLKNSKILRKIASKFNVLAFKTFYHIYVK